MMSFFLKMNDKIAESAFKIHIKLAFKRTVVELSALIRFSSEQLFEIVVGGYYTVAFTLLLNKLPAHYLIKRFRFVKV